MSEIKILLVEDEMIIAQKIKMILTGMGYEILSIVDTGEKAILKAAEICPDLMLMDIVLKGDMDGIEAAAHIREQSNVPIIYLTAYGDDKTLDRAKATEPVGYILKPFGADQMRVTIESGLELHTSRQKLDAAQREYHLKLEEDVKKRTHELYLANAELERANRLKDEFLANMSHELRTPLTAVLGVSEALIEQVYGPLNEKQLRSLQRVMDSGEHLLSLINDILDLSKISEGKMELDIGQISVDAVCQASMKMIKQIASKKNQRLSLGIDTGVTHIRADMLRVKQMLVNLLTNAVKFTPERGKIALEVNGIPEQDMVEFAVRDTGMGISREDMKKLFKPFVQLDGGLSREHEGTGLGLAMVSRLAEMHGGSVSVESEEGKYSRFAVMLPWESE